MIRHFLRSIGLASCMALASLGASAVHANDEDITLRVTYPISLLSPMGG
jgi:hypothetical protein